MWTVWRYTNDAPFENVQRAQPVAQTQSQTKKSKKNDVVARMCRVFDRDYYHESGIDLSKSTSRTKAASASEQVPVDDILTAEEVFAASHENPSVPGPWYIIGNGKPRPANDYLDDYNRYPQSERLRYCGLMRIHRMAALTLYNDRCGDRPLDRDRAGAAAIIESQFKKLPREVQDRALDHEVKTIEARTPFYDQEGKILIDPGGWQWFCSKMNSDIKGGYADPMFKTAREGFFPIDEN